MKIKHLLLAAFALIGGANAWADTDKLTVENGWQKVSDLSSMNISDYYFAFVDDSRELMLSLGHSVEQSTENDYQTFVYTTCEAAEMNPSMLWTLEAFDGGYNIKNAEKQTHFLQTEWGAAWYCRTHDNGGGDKSWGKFNITLSDGKYLLENGKYPGQWVGPWASNNFVNGAGVAANKPVAERGYFQIYAIAKTDVDVVANATAERPANMTYKVVNAGFECGKNNLYGWTNSGSLNFVGQGNKSLGGTVGSRYVECYHQKGTLDLNQTLANMPAGKYKVTAVAQTNGGKLYANEASVEVNTNAVYEVETILVTDGNLKIGFSATDDGTKWTAIDDIHVYYYGPVTDLSAFVETLAASVTQAKGLQDATMNADVKAALGTAISTYETVSYTTKEEYTTAIDAVKSAIDAAEASIALYTSVAAKVAALDEAGQTAFAATTSGQKLADNTLTATDDITADYVAAAKAQTSNNADFTSLIINPSYETGDMTGWTAEGNGGAWTLMTRAGGDDPIVGNYWYEKYGWAGKIDVHQTITGVPAGTYVVGVRTLDQASITKLVAKCGETTAETTINKATAADFTVEIVVAEDNSDLTIGLYCENHTANKWVGFDNWTLRHSPLAYEDLTPAEGKMNAEVAAAQTTAIEAYNADRNAETLAAAKAAIAAAEASIADYTAKKLALDAQADLMSKTNVYDADAYAAAGWAALAAGYENGTLTNTDAVVNPNAITGWHASTNFNFLLTPWTIGGEACNNFDKALYINTWSTEGENDGSNFKVPFFEYWTGDPNSLANTTISTTVNDLPNGVYSISAWVRVRAKNGVDATEATGITFCGVDATEGTQVGTSQFNISEVTAEAVVTDGTLTISFDVQDANISWLSFKNVKYTKLDEAPMAVGEAGYATFVAPFEVAVPAGVKAYTVDAVDTDEATLVTTEVGATIAPNTPVLLEGSLAATTVYGKAEDGTPTAGLLVGVYEATPAIEGTYVLQSQTAGVGFYKVETAGVTTIPANRAYLKADDSSVKAFYFDSETAIQAIEALTAGKAQIFDLNGRQLSRLQKGINIVNGKKIMVK